MLYFISQTEPKGYMMKKNDVKTVIVKKLKRIGFVSAKAKVGLGNCGPELC